MLPRGFVASWQKSTSHALCSQKQKLRKKKGYRNKYSDYLDYN
jgi:hypothetical protein